MINDRITELKLELLGFNSCSKNGNQFCKILNEIVFVIETNFETFDLLIRSNKDGLVYINEVKTINEIESEIEASNAYQKELMGCSLNIN